MTLFHLNRNTRLRNLTIGILALGLAMGETVWAGPPIPRKNAPYPQPGRIYQQISSNHQAVRVGSDQYIFHEGVYYRRDPKGFKVVRPPRGAVVTHLPMGFETMIVAGVTYFLLAGVYYQKAPSGYVVVDTPQDPVLYQEANQNAVGSTVVVEVEVLNVRSGPGMSHAVIHQVHYWDTLVIMETSPGWYYVRLPDSTFGWVAMKFTRIMDPDAQE